MINFTRDDVPPTLRGEPPPESARPERAGVLAWGPFAVERTAGDAGRAVYYCGELRLEDDDTLRYRTADRWFELPALTMEAFGADGIRATASRFDGTEDQILIRPLRPRDADRFSLSPGAFYDTLRAELWT